MIPPEEPGASTYAAAGVDIDAGDHAVALIAEHARATARPEVLGGLGGFAGAFAARFEGIRDPVLLSATDGVGTKLVIAQTLDRHDTVGLDLVAMVVDDIACHGGEPLFLLDYVACGRLVPERIATIVGGIARGCRIAGCALLGGETAEHPGAMDADAYDLAAFAVGVADRDAMLGPERVREGDAIVGLASSGLHANGYSLVRTVVLDHDLALDEPVGALGCTLGEELLRPTRIHAPAVLALARLGLVRAAAHVTGGGIPGNLARAIPEGLGALLRRGTWPEPPVFAWLASVGGIPAAEMLRTYNLGLGMLLVVAAGRAEEAVAVAATHGERAFVVGEVRRGDRRVVIEG